MLFLGHCGHSHEWFGAVCVQICCWNLTVLEVGLSGTQPTFFFSLKRLEKQGEEQILTATHVRNMFCQKDAFLKGWNCWAEGQTFDQSSFQSEKVWSQTSRKLINPILTWQKELKTENEQTTSNPLKPAFSCFHYKLQSGPKMQTNRHVQTHECHCVQLLQPNISQMINQQSCISDWTQSKYIIYGIYLCLKCSNTFRGYCTIVEKFIKLTKFWKEKTENKGSVENYCKSMETSGNHLVLWSSFLCDNISFPQTKFTEKKLKGKKGYLRVMQVLHLLCKKGKL